MSCYEWERGELTIPSKEWPKLKAAVRDAYNGLQNAAYEYAVRVYDELKTRGRGKRGFDHQRELRAILHTDPYPNQTRDYWGFVSRGRRDPLALPEGIDSWVIERAIFRRDAADPSKPLKPRKKDFPKATNKDRVFRVGSEATIAFSDDKTRVVEWDVPENNHAIEHAREHPIAGAFFAALDKIEWTRNSGGVFWSDNEYARDAARENPFGGGNTISATYGPRGRELHDRRFRGQLAAAGIDW